VAAWRRCCSKKEASAKEENRHVKPAAKMTAKIWRRKAYGINGENRNIIENNGALAAKRSWPACRNNEGMNQWWRKQHQLSEEKRESGNRRISGVSLSKSGSLKLGGERRIRRNCRKKKIISEK
jgi:hypothetical protein